MNFERLPALFFGHGSPMHAIDVSRFSEAWKKIGEMLPRPKAILVISAHWFIAATRVTASLHPDTIHDFYGFPDELYAQQYPAPGSFDLASQVVSLLAPDCELDYKWGFDHGAWSILKHIYPEADIPVVQLSIDRRKPPQYHYDIGQKLSSLREQGVLILGSGNIVHSFAEMSMGDVSSRWAEEYEQYIIDNLKNPEALINFRQSSLGRRANPTPDHFLPLLYVAGTTNVSEEVTIPIRGITLGSMSMMVAKYG